ncbi:hypothetical protein J3R83DRAFT_2470 [Lanmaoa asiatica]|nr:hypothetical protein J3R83DRAFT_2470 [Lanmaoa asiatica]
MKRYTPIELRKDVIKASLYLRFLHRSSDLYRLLPSTSLIMPAPNRLNDEIIDQFISHGSRAEPNSPFMETDVLIAGSGPVGAAYARVILDNYPDAHVIMADIGSQDSPVIGAHHKNSIKYQKDIDKFGNLVHSTLNLGGDGWKPSVEQTLIFQGSNPKQKPEVNLKASSVTRAVGGMGTHWTCACPIPHAKERVRNPIPSDELDALLDEARVLLNVHEHEYDHSIRQTVVKEALQAHLPDPNRVRNLPLAVKRRDDNPHYVTWTGPNTVLGDTVNKPRFTLLAGTPGNESVERLPGTRRWRLTQGHEE